MAHVTEIKPPEALGVENTPTETAPTSPTPEPTGRKPPNRPPKGAPPRPDPPFFDRVASVPKSDWGSRAFMYVYADEPVCNPKTFGTTRYMLKSSVPILDLEQLKQDYGSFKGWMSLNLRKSGKDQTDEIDRYDFEIYDPKHPPKIPRSAWANDPRNKKWLDLLPPEKPTASEGASSLIEGARLYKEIRDDVKDELEPDETTSPVDQTRATLETMKLAKELFATPTTAPAAPAADPLATAISLATTMMQMKADNPMVDFLREQMKLQHDELMQMRKEIADRDKDREKAQPKGILEQLTELATAADKFEPLKKLFAWGTGSTDAPLRAGRMNTLEFISDFGPKALETFSPLINAAATKMMNPTNGTPVNPPQSIQQPPNGADFFQRFISEIVTPKMLMYFEQELDGDDFADWIYSGFPEYWERLKNFKHPMIPGMQGAPAIITAYRNTPTVWPRVAAQEARFIAFVEAFCAFDPKEPQDPNIIDAEPIEADPQEERLS